MKFDPRFHSDAAEGIAEYLFHLNTLTDCALIDPEAPKILPSDENDADENALGELDFINYLSGLGMVGGTGIEPVTPTMST